MEKQTKWEKAGEEIMRFMRGKYVLGEVPGKYYDIRKYRKFMTAAERIMTVLHYDY